MIKAVSRIFCDQRYPDQTVTEEQLKREYGQHIASGDIDPEEQSFSRYLFNCMQINGGTLAEVIPEKDEKAQFTFMIRETPTMTVTIGADSFDEAKELIEEAYNNGETSITTVLWEQNSYHAVQVANPVLIMRVTGFGKWTRECF